ncbi:MAG: hypothetical protein GEU95_01155 [Rhizobiales bacterium]|nr:hypothetical protein [Hyphomicrobiales bacterium]
MVAPDRRSAAIVYLWGGEHEQRMRRPHEGPQRRAEKARVIRLPSLRKFSRDEVRVMARRVFRAERAAMRTR